jgi:hypothetical protein
MALRSVLEHSVAPTSEAERRLKDLHRRAREMAVSGLVLTAATIPAAVIIPPLGIALGTGAAAAFALALLARSRRRSLLLALLGNRDAYWIEAVQHEGICFSSADRRQRLARWLRSVVGFADGAERLPAYSAISLTDRVLARRERLLSIADAFEATDHPVHPASVVLVHQLLTRPGSSPLYNPGLDDELLDFALNKVEAGVTGDRIRQSSARRR